MKFFTCTQIIFGILLAVVCEAQTLDTISRNKTYVIGPMPEFNEIMKLNKEDSKLEKNGKKVHQHILKLHNEKGTRYNGPRYNYSNNRARITLETFRNGHLSEKDNNAKDAAMHCECELENNEKITIKIGFGLSAAFAYNLTIEGDSFETHYIPLYFGTPKFKNDLKDPIMVSSIVTLSQNQYMILDQKPTFRENQQISGYITFSSYNFYEHTSPEIFDTLRINAKAHFTCNVFKRKY
ncbi:MAG: hypothetical protein NVV82_00780 [Sporocytophaga sp.]|nr:hypothetical protein [Sporocytophaga sp.]